MMNILIRSPNWIGDAVLATSALSYLKKRIPDSSIKVLAVNWVKDLFLHHPAVEDIIPLPQGVGKEKIHLLQRIKKEKYDYGILLTNSFSSAFFLFGAGLPERLGYATDGRGLLLTEKVPLPENLESIHQKDYYLNLVKQVWPGKENPPISLRVSKEEKEHAKTILKSLDIAKNERVIGLNPGAAYGPAKRWPLEKYNALAREILKSCESKILIFGNKKEAELGNVISRGIEKDTVNLMGKTTLRELIALIQRCQVFITNDTGPMHIASALKVPVVAIFGPTSPQRTSPLGVSTVIKKEVACAPCKNRICPSDHKCMEKIEVEEVLKMFA